MTLSRKERLRNAVKFSEEILKQKGPMPAIVLCQRLKEDYGLYDVSAKELSAAIKKGKRNKIKYRKVIHERGFGNAMDSMDTLIYYVGKDNIRTVGKNYEEEEWE